jgi:hypothetical protein
MKYGFVSLCLLAIALAGRSQAYEGSVQFDKKKQPALVMDYDFSTQAVTNAFVGYIESLGFKAREEKGIFNRDKGFVVFRNALVPELHPERIDYIFKVEKKSRKEDEASVLYLVLNRDNANLLQSLKPEDLTRIKKFLSGFTPQIEAASLELQIREQETVLAKAEKKLADLKSEQESLEKKLADNKKDQEAAQKDIEDQKQRLGQLQGQRKKPV